jgi:hypothetical protein
MDAATWGVLRRVAGLMVLAAALPAAGGEMAWGTTTSAPAGTRAELFGIAAAAPDDIWAVGGYNPGQPPTAVLTRPYAEHWDGSAWSATPVPLGQVFTSQLVKLRGAAAIGPGDAWTVGHVDDVGSLAAFTLAYRWDGNQWNRVATPNPAPPGQGDRLTAVVARSAGEAWAVGSSRYPQQSLVLRWSGTQWQLQATPDIGALVAVSADDDAKVVASGARRLMMTHGDGQWTLLPDPPEPYPPGALQLSGVALKGGRAWVVGSVARALGDGIVFGPYVAALKDGAWTQVNVVDAGAASLTGVAASALGVWATSVDGQAYKLTTSGAMRQVMPPRHAAALNAVTTDPLGQPWAAGTRYGESLQPALYNAPGIGQGGIRVTTGFAQASVTWIGPVTGSGTTDVYGHFSVGGLPAGAYQVIASGPGCSPGVADARVKAGKVRAVSAPIDC